MDDLMDSMHYIVTVKLQTETGMNKSTGEPKYKKFTETYVVKAGSPQRAADIVEKEMKDTTFEWFIQSVKKTKITKIIE